MSNRSDLLGLGIGLVAAVAITGCINMIDANVPNPGGIPTASSADGVISAEEWRDLYPNQYESWYANEENDNVISYLADDQDPYLKTIYEGYGFAIDYGSARGHSYGLIDVNKTERPHAKANCLTCKTPNFTKMVNDQGKEVYAMPFDEVNAQMDQTQSVACYTCHENQVASADNLVATHDYTIEALGAAASDGSIPKATVACGQCHMEYYFDPETSATTAPWNSDVSSMTPEKIIAYYNEIDFADWTQEDTGARMLKAQHPEFETILNGPHAAISCASCHMEQKTDADGNKYTSHKFESPLENENLLATCASCHGDADMVEMVHGVQKEVTTKEKEVGNKLKTLKENLAAAVADGKMSEDELNKVRQMYREAQFYFDFDYVENSEGAHSHMFAMDCLNTADEMTDEALGLLDV